MIAIMLGGLLLTWALAGRSIADEPAKQQAKPRPANAEPAAPANNADKRQPASGTKQQPPSTEEGQQNEPPGLPPLAKMIELALQNNPDIRVADARVREAEAELHQKRLEIVRQVITLSHSLEAQQALIGRLEKQVGLKEDARNRARAQFQAAVEGSAQLVLQAEAELLDTETAFARAQAELADMRARLDYLLGADVRNVLTGDSGTIPAGAPLIPGGSWVPAAMPAETAGPTDRDSEVLIGDLRMRRTNAEQLQKKLGEMTEVNFFETPLRDCMSYLSELHHMAVTFDRPAFRSNNVKVDDVLVDLQMSGIPLRAALQAMEDSFRGTSDVRFVVRDYGLLVSVEGQVPKGAVPISEFLEGMAEQAGRH